MEKKETSRSPESGETTEPVEVVNALRWVAERARDGSTLYLDPADAAVYEAYAACVESLTAELSSARAEVERLTIRDGLYAKLREKIAEYFGGDGGYAVLQDGVYALRKSESTARERAERAEQDSKRLDFLDGRTK